ncbi:expressed unknown protein [Seminavis robusta]|uniref:DDE Tnp4 domain-containing protein n=1 Tax=Seminavis robusta TaxID=568900 RepID=A0A9N8E3N8_9STRA|nr:expressed unknown protein [Seminavis robusta]|eukprot:Sro621_g176820.1 n/a (397) ;mRNA; f:41961-43151
MEGDQYWVHQRRMMMAAASLMLQNSSFRQNLDDEGRSRRQRVLPRSALLSPNASPWEAVYHSGSDQAMITITGYDNRAFRALLELFTPWFNTHTPWTGKQDGTTCKKLKKRRFNTGRNRIINASSCLALVLTWYRFRGALFTLQGWFGFTSTHTSVWLRFGRRGLLLLLQNHHWGRVAIPTDEKIERLKAAVNQRHPALVNVYCVADGLKLLFERHDDLDEQSMYYNGWTHDHYITNLFVFSIDGYIIHCILNAPGSMHDSTLASYGGTYELLEAIYNRTGGVCCVDSAFTAANNPFLVKSSENFSTAESAEEIIVRDQATSLRQAAEWGMRALQGAFPRLKDRIHLEENGERLIILKLMTCLYNARITLVGLNQLQNTYVPHWSVDARCFIVEHP